MLDEETLKRLLPPYHVILHNDDHNSMDHVVRSLTKCVPSLTVERAAEIMFEAHRHGQATVIRRPVNRRSGGGHGPALPAVRRWRSP